MNIAIIGTGIAGNVAAHYLSRDHRITVFEANEYVGGHTHTHDIEWHGRCYALDTGFLVFNHRTYPNFIRLLKELNVPIQASSMSFSVKCERTGLEYNGTTLNTLFAQRRNLFRPSFYRMIRDILRFNREAPHCLSRPDLTLTLGDYLRQGGFSREFIDWYLIPMGAAIWSADPSRMWEMPAQFFIRFFHNHGMLSVNDRPVWYVIRGGSREYVTRLTAGFRECIRTGTRVEGIRRNRRFVTVLDHHGAAERFDAVFVATHGDQALRLLRDASPLEEEVLGPMTTQSNEVVLHTDARMLPARPRAWAAWNYHLPAHPHHRVAVTYNLNILQGIQAPVQFCVTLNHSGAIDPGAVIRRLTYSHPRFTVPSVAAQQRQAEINGKRRTYFCGAYWQYGFHEDGVVSALNAVDHFRRTLSHAQLPVRRAGTASAV